MDVHAIVNRLRDLSKDPQNRAAIAKDEASLSGLVLCLSNPKEEIILTSLEAIKYLAILPGNRPVMRNHMGMIQSLKTLQDHDNVDIAEAADHVYRTLVPRPIPTPTHKTASPVVKGVPTASSKGAFFLGQGNKNAKIYLIELTGTVTPTTEAAVKEELLKIRGIISFTFDKISQRLTVRTRADITAERVVNQVNKVKAVKASHIVKNEEGEEVTLTYGKDYDQENMPAYPDYLPEDEDDEYDPAGKDNNNSYSIQRIRKIGDPSEKSAGGWFGGAASYISKSLYW